MEEEGDVFDPYFDRPRPQRSLNVMVANPREIGVVEFLEAITDGKLYEVSLKGGFHDSAHVCKSIL